MKKYLRYFCPSTFAYSTIFSFLVTFAFGQTGADWQMKVSPSLLTQTRDGGNAHFIILLKEQADISDAYRLNSKYSKAAFVHETLLQTSKASQKNLIAYLSDRAIEFHSIHIINAIYTKGNLELIQTIAERQDVQKLVADPVITFAQPIETGPDQSGSRSAIEWGIDMIRADEVWAMGYRGQGTVIGGQDTGYEWDHPALKQQYRGYDATLDTADHDYNWHDAIREISPLHSDTINPCGLDVKEPCDDSGHGTHTMGTMIGLDGENQIGVAPESEWCACRNMERGYGTPFTYIECFQWFLAPTDLNGENPDPSKAPHVINNSWGCPPIEGCDTTNFEIMDMVVNNLRAAGIVVVVSAGNDGSGCSSVYTPAAIYEGSFSVGATAINDTIAGFSSRGPVTVDQSNRLKPNVSAPGVWVRSSTPGGDYGHSSGTSMAGPHVAGLVALIISANPALAGQVDVIEDIIESTAVPKTTDQNCGDIPGSEVPNHTYGYGRVDALAAVEAALALIETSVEENISTMGISVFPNPVTHTLHISSKASIENIAVTLMDMQGRILYHQTLDVFGSVHHEIDVAHLPSGFYLYKISSGYQTDFGKLVKAE